MPVNLWEKPTSDDWFDPKTYRPETRGFNRQAVQFAAEALLAAEFPVILAGSGVAIAGAQQHLHALAELLPARVATSPRGKGLFPEDDPLSLGILGNAGHRDARNTILGDEVNVLFTVGASLSETSTFNWTAKLRPRKTLIQLDINVNRIGRNYPVNLPLVGDAQAILVELVYHIHRLLRDGAVPASRWGERAPLTRGHERYEDSDARTSDHVPVTPQRWRVDLEEVLPHDAIVFSDIGGHMLFNLHHLCIGRGQRFLINLGFGSMGHGTIAPIGAALAFPRRPVFALVGDGCFAMNGMDLITAGEHEIPVIWIVENNNMHGITWHCSKLLSGGTPMRAAVYKRPLEVAALARAMGLHARVVERPGQIQDAVREALRLRVPYVIEVRVDGSVPPPLGERAKSLAGFIEEMSANAPDGPFDVVPWPETLTARVVAPGPAPRLHGYDTERDLAPHYGLAELTLLSLTGELPAPPQARGFEVATTFVAPIAVSEAPSHAAVLARLCSGSDSAVLGTPQSRSPSRRVRRSPGSRPTGPGSSVPRGRLLPRSCARVRKSAFGWRYCAKLCVPAASACRRSSRT